MSEEPVNGLDPLAGVLRQVGEGGPPAAVDAAVRSHARSAARRRRASAWTLPAALAATVLIAFTLVVQVQHEDMLPAEDEVASADVSTEAPASTAILQEAVPAAPHPPVAGPAAGQAAEKASSAVLAPAARMRSTAEADVGTATPEQWLERIEVLEAAGRREEARAERQRLEAAYPGWLAAHPPGRD